MRRTARNSFDQRKAITSFLPWGSSFPESDGSEFVRHPEDDARGLGGEVRRTNICKIGFHVQDYILLGIGLIPYILWIWEVVM